VDTTAGTRAGFWGAMTAGLLLAALAPGVRAAETNTPPASAKEAAQQPPGWTVRCDNAGQGLACKAIQTIVLAKTRQLLLSVSVSKPADGPDMTMLLQLPHGLFNPAGVTVAVDAAKPQTLDIQTCDNKGCYAGTPIKANEIAAMKSGQKLNVVFQDLKKQNITVPVPLKGFDEALKKL
jgi:invasion protein IalB